MQCFGQNNNNKISNGLNGLSQLLLSHSQHLLPWNPGSTYNPFLLTTRDKARPSESPPDMELPLVSPIETSNLSHREVIHCGGRGAQASAPSELLRAKDALLHQWSVVKHVDGQVLDCIIHDYD